MEQWKTITTHPNYEVSNLGRVRNKTTNEFKKPSPNKQGYVAVNLYPNLKVYMVHRLVAEYFIPSDDKTKTIVNHIDGIRSNNFVTNLEWCTQQQNAQHMVTLGNNKDHNGVNNPRSKFTEEDILDIRKDDRPVSVIAKKYNVAETTITNIKNGTRYKNVGGDIREKGYKGNQSKGSKVNTSVLTNEQVYNIKYNLKDSTTKEIMDKYSISSSVVYKIRGNKTWKHI